MRRTALLLLSAAGLVAVAPAAQAGIVSATVTGVLSSASTNGVVGWAQLFGIDEHTAPPWRPFDLTYSYDLDRAGSHAATILPTGRTETFLFPASSAPGAVSISLAIDGHTLVRSVGAGSGDGMVGAEAISDSSTKISVATGAGPAADLAAWLSFSLVVPEALTFGATLYDAVANPASSIWIGISYVQLTGLIQTVTPLSSSTPQAIPAPAGLPMFAAGLGVLALLRRTCRGRRL